MKTSRVGWADSIAKVTVNHSWKVLIVVMILTVISLGLAEHLELKMNFTDMLAPTSPTVIAYQDIQRRWGDPSIVIALEGERDQIVKMAEALDPKIAEVKGLYNIQTKFPNDFIIDHGFILQKPKDVKRSLVTFENPDMIKVLNGFNNDYEREYSDSEDNLKRDELDVSRSLLGISRMLEVLESNLLGEEDAPPVKEAVDAMLTGEPWMLSLDRKMLLLTLVPEKSMLDGVEELLVVVGDIQTLLDEMASDFPSVEANMTGMGQIGVDEMESVGLYTQILGLVAMVLIYILLARSFRGWVLPLIALAPLLVGIFWTMGLLEILFGSLNMFTIMMMLVLLGLGIDFTIHLMSRYIEERGLDKSVVESVYIMLSDTGKGVLTGGLTTAAAFFALMVAKTTGVFEFGVAAGMGVILTLISVFFMLPVLLSIRERRAAKKGKAIVLPPSALRGWPRIGNISVFVWNKAGIVIPLFILLGIISIWAIKHTDFEYNFLELEPAGLKSIALQKEIPTRFGISEQAAWAIVGSVEESRAMKEAVKEKSTVGMVSAISDMIPPEDRYDAYKDRLNSYRAGVEKTKPIRWNHASDKEALQIEINRLWDNLDLIGNIAYQGAIDRIVLVIDNMTGYNSETDKTDQTAVLPRLIALLDGELDEAACQKTRSDWFAAMKPALSRMASLDHIDIEDVPEVFRKNFIPRDNGDEFLVSIMPRESLWEKDKLDRFNGQVDEIDPNIVSSSKLFIVMIVETLVDGRKGALLALGIIALLLLFHFKGPLGLVATIPLIGSALFMVGAMYIIGMKYNYLNLIAVPIILGIGIDDGVHALHRFKQEKLKNSKAVYNSFKHVGRAIMLTSLTTMIGFGSLGFYTMKGMSSFGIVLFMGVGFCFVTTVVVLPAILRVVYSRSNKNIPELDEKIETEKEEIPA